MAAEGPGLSAGIIAAGEGSRLRAAGVPLKPLLPVSGRPLVHWVVTSLRAAGVRSIAILVNSRGGAIHESLRSAFPDLSWTFLLRDTASSWESFRLVSLEVARLSDRFLLSTADAIVPPRDCARFVREAFSPAPGWSPQAAIALTRFAEDEKPLWAETDASGRVTAVGEDVRGREAVTCGLYALTAEAARAMPAASAHGKLRDFWRDLVRSERAVRGVLLGDTVDVDRPDDLTAAEKVISCFDA